MLSEELTKSSSSSSKISPDARTEYRMTTIGKVAEFSAAYMSEEAKIEMKLYFFYGTLIDPLKVQAVLGLLYCPILR